jgi:hypothetical protein
MDISAGIVWQRSHAFARTRPANEAQRSSYRESAFAAASIPVAVGEMCIDFVRDTAAAGRLQMAGAAHGREVMEGDASMDSGIYDEPVYWWKQPFVYVYVVSPTGPHDHKVLSCRALDSCRHE